MSQKIVNVSGRARRLTKEMLLYWKRYEKVEKEHRRRAEKEAQEQLRLDIELREVHSLSHLFFIYIIKQEALKVSVSPC